MQSETEILSVSNTEPSFEIRPTLFVCQGKVIAEYRLDGVQVMGRPVGDSCPDIPLYFRYASRRHGILETHGGVTVYQVLPATNGTRYNGNPVVPGTSLTLKDGDEFVIPSETDNNDESVLLIYACTSERIRMWRDFQAAAHDNLTGLSRRDDFINWFNRNLNMKDYQTSVLFILDVDDFKQINDHFGHNAGDMVLKIVADALKSAVRYADQVCRWGGDEFVGVIPGTRETAGERLKRLGQHIREESDAAGFPVTVSIGLVDTAEPAARRDLSKLIELADQAMYGIKGTGKGMVGNY